MSDRVGDWMQTYTGRQFWPLDPRPEEVFIEDIAHALSMLCRFGGHCLRYYSVAEHSIYVSRLLPPEVALVGLLHDATEAYVADVPRPLKRFIPGYKEVEEAVWLAVARRFGLPSAVPVEVKSADNAALATEAIQVMASPPSPWCLPERPASFTIVGMTPSQAKEEFMRCFFDCGGQQ
jgi:hypothetical protein